MNRPDDRSLNTDPRPTAARFAVRRAVVGDAEAFAAMLANPAVFPQLLMTQALYRRFGFVEEGVHRCHALRDGVYVDSLSMARLNPAPLRGFPRD
jgi:hypothetical protein